MTRAQKEALARMVQRPLARLLLGAAVRLIVPRQRVGVAVILFDHRDRILMLRHVFHPATPWGVPGGWLAGGESPGDGALRELREETGLDAVIGPPVYLSHEATPAHLGIAYTAEVVPGPIHLSDEIIEAGWFAPDALPGPLLAFTRTAIAAGVAHRRAGQRLGVSPG